ncbi:MAG: hypothetical protein JWP03_3270 [Phycisphaerales bacterium]|jgi:hypothetical protein|nr:hypothetical protein [Phycisphaerales bacterium]
MTQKNRQPWRCARTVGATAVALVPLLTLCGCATVVVRKVPAATEYVHWTDDMQREADSIHGIRFYLPRPFLNVFESFPIRTDIYFAQGVVSPDGKFIRLTSITPLNQPPTSLAVNVPAESLMFPAPSLQLPGFQGKPGDGTAAATPEIKTPVAVGEKPQAPPAAPTPLPPSSPTPKTGVNTQGSTNNNGAFAYQPLRGNFDLLYLPDFDEQYAVDGYAGLGNANFQVNLGQGWSLQGFNSLTDNSEINKRIFDLIDTSAQLAKTAASAELGQLLPLVQQAAKNVTPGGVAALQGNPQTLPTDIRGTAVTLRVIVLHYAARGLYPVIKPHELQERIADSRTTYCGLDMFKVFPKVEWFSDYDKNSLLRSQQAVEPQGGHFTVPRYPYQYISFNTFDYLGIEVIAPSAEAFKARYPGTGTDNENGAARAGEILNLLKELQSLYGTAPAPAPTPAPVPPTTTAPGDQKILADINALKEPNASPTPYALNQARFEKPDTVSAELVVAGAHPPLSEKDARDALLKDINALPSVKAAGKKIVALHFYNLPDDLDTLQKFYADLKKLAYPPSGKPGDARIEYSVTDGWISLATPAQGKSPTAHLTLNVTRVAQLSDVSPADLEKSFTEQAAELLSHYNFTPPFTIGSVTVKSDKP